MRKLVVVLVFLFLPFQLANASDKSNSPSALKPLMESFMAEKPWPKKERRNSVNGLFGVCKGLMDRLPTLSPSEKKWIESEVSAGRLDNIVSSLEVQKRKARDTVSNCAMYTGLLKEGIGNLSSEAVYWIKLSREFSDYSQKETLEFVAQKTGIKLSKAERDLWSEAARFFLVRAMMRHAIWAIEEGDRLR